MNMQKVKKTFRLNEKDRKKLIKKIIYNYIKKNMLFQKKRQFFVCDYFSFGIVVYEMMFLKMPLNSMAKLDMK